MDKIKEIIEKLLGNRVEDSVTGFKGVVTSISVDLYGCIQGCVNPGMGKDKKLGDQYWFDVNRLKVKSKEKVMPLPDFLKEKGADIKPVIPSM